MSIRFYCPLGHRLQVPDARAGKKGRCPLCQQKVIVPVSIPKPSGRPKLGEGKEIVLDDILAAELGIEPSRETSSKPSVRAGTQPIPTAGGTPVLPPPLPRSKEPLEPPPVRRSKSDRTGRRRSGNSDSSMPPLPPTA